MKIRGAVLEKMGSERPYASSRPLVISDLELDGPGPDEVLIKVEAAGLCHSDLSVVDGNRIRPVPMLLGHEAAGIVVEVGENVTDLSPGHRVVTVFLPLVGSAAAATPTEGCPVFRARQPTITGHSWAGRCVSAGRVH
jgi:alcohol dehydrogenase